MAGSGALDPTCVPAPIRQLLGALAGDGHSTWLVGGCVRDLLRGEPVRDFDAATAAAPERVLQLFPRGVVIGAGHGTVMIPTAAGPLDVTPLRAGPRVEDDLAHRDFTVNAIAFDPLGGVLLDPFGGRADLARGRLRAVGAAPERFREDPLRILRAARLLATLGLEPDADLEAAMRAHRRDLGRVARERIRSELGALLLGPRAGDAIALLRRTGVEALLLPHAAADAARVVDALPAALELRLAAWLRGAPALSILRRLRFPKRSCQRVEHLLRLHPVEQMLDPERDSSVRRLLQRARDDLQDLVRLRRAEIRAGSAGAAEAGRLDAAERAVARVQRAGELALRRHDLALDGRAVMQILGCRPGPEIGRALAWLTDRVLEDPRCNTPEGLRALLARWRSAEPEKGP
jgi:tRNA nucleotidyltransferase (CCA-adding enzyme)